MSKQAQPGRIRWFLTVGIDDLAKYRVVELLARSPELSGGVEFFSNTLGLKPLALVAQLLEELAQRGVLCRSGCESGTPASYAIAADGWMRRRIARLYRLSQDARVRAALLAQLARRSLRKAAAHARRHLKLDDPTQLLLPVLQSTG